MDDGALCCPITLYLLDVLITTACSSNATSKHIDKLVDVNPLFVLINLHNGRCIPMVVLLCLWFEALHALSLYLERFASLLLVL